MCNNGDRTCALDTFDSSAVCILGTCQTSCTTGNLNDNNNCGACGVKCSAGSICDPVSQICVTPCPSGGQLNDNSNCGACGTKCSDGSFCDTQLLICVTLQVVL